MTNTKVLKKEKRVHIFDLLFGMYLDEGNTFLGYDKKMIRETIRKINPYDMDTP